MCDRLRTKMWRYRPLDCDTRTADGGQAPPAGTRQATLTTAVDALQQFHEAGAQADAVRNRGVVTTVMRGHADHPIARARRRPAVVADPGATARTAGVARIAVLEGDQFLFAFDGHERSGIHLDHLTVED